MSNFEAIEAGVEEGKLAEGERAEENEEKIKNGYTPLNVEKNKKAPKVLPQGRFIGEQRQEFALWGHNMSLVAALSLIVLGIFGILWVDSGQYGCKINGKVISANLIRAGHIIDGVEGRCLPPSFSTSLITSNSSLVIRKACCDPEGRSSKRKNLGGSVWIGMYCILAGFFCFIFETNTKFGFGLWMPTDWCFYHSKLSLQGIVIASAGILAFGTYATCTAGALCVIAGIVYQYAAHRQEAGDGGRSKYSAAATKKKESSSKKNMLSLPIHWINKRLSVDARATTFWLFLYFSINAIMFFYTLHVWINTIENAEANLKNDDVLLDNCDECPKSTYFSTKDYTRWRDECELNKSLIRNGPLSYWAPLAKACGNTLNFNCALLIMPVTRKVIIFLNELSVGYMRAQKRNAWFESCFRSPFARYVPVAKNIDFHKLISTVMLILGLVHTVAHFFNYWQAPYFTEARFAKWGWAGTSIVTGALILLAMFFIHTAALTQVRHANFEIFWFAHHFFILYYAMLLIHGPVFYLWSIIPIGLYLWERQTRLSRGSIPMVVSRVEWIAPVLAVHFRPIDKSLFDFEEGTYVMLNCPFISQAEWHPFTISSARGDLFTGDRVSLETGEKVIPIPPPTNAPNHIKKKWKKYCPVSLYSKLNNDQTYDTLLDHHETAYHDFVSVHIKVHERDDGTETWTKKLKDYLEMMAPHRKYPFHFTRRDTRGELQIGRQFGPDTKQILRIDGPHAAPAMHYKHYGTVMLIGAGIGMTPCASVLTAMLKYRWRLNFKPEILHFYWVVAHPDVRAFEWFIHRIAELEYELLKQRHSGAVAPRNYAEIHIFVTRPPKDCPNDLSMRSASTITEFSNDAKSDPKPVFTANQLFAEMLYPQTPAANMTAAMEQPKHATNRFQDTWIWNGRPVWSDIFSSVRNQRQHRDIGVCFCGTPFIGSFHHYLLFFFYLFHRKRSCCHVQALLFCR